jgi:soluble lytic murein transglycosylase
MSAKGAGRGHRRGILAAVALAAAIALAAFLAWDAAHRLPDLSRFDATIEAAAGEFRIDPDLLRGLVAAESGGDPDAVSRAGARGLLQLMPATAREQAGRLGLGEISDERLLAPAVNLRLGAAYLAWLLARYDGSDVLALAAYNAGPGRVDRWRRDAPGADPMTVVERGGFAETTNHVRKVLDFRDRYRGARS